MKNEKLLRLHLKSIIVQDHGEIVEVDLKRHITGESKRYAFITFSSLKEDPKTFFTKKHFILNKEVEVEPQKIKTPRESEQENLETNLILVSGRRTAYLTDESIEEFFTKIAGTVKKVRPAENGRLVEFLSEESVNRVMENRSYVIFNNHVNVSKAFKTSSP